MNEQEIINYAEFINYNFEQLSQNYKERHKHIFKTHLYEYCNYIYTGMKMNAWLPVEHTKGIIIKKGINK